LAVTTGKSYPQRSANLLILRRDPVDGHFESSHRTLGQKVVDGKEC
jgi:hypothetical protein